MLDLSFRFQEILLFTQCYSMQYGYKSDCFSYLQCSSITVVSFRFFRSILTISRHFLLQLHEQIAPTTFFMNPVM